MTPELSEAPTLRASKASGMIPPVGPVAIEVSTSGVAADAVENSIPIGCGAIALLTKLNGTSTCDSSQGSLPENQTIGLRSPAWKMSSAVPSIVRFDFNVVGIATAT